MEIIEQITWGQYFLVLGMLTLIYYAVIIMIMRRAAEKKDAGFQEDDMEGEPEAYAHDVKPAGDLMEELEVAVTEIEAVITEAGKEATKADVLMRIRPVVANFGGLRLPAYRFALQNFIIKHMKETCGVDLVAEELEEDWDDLPR